MKKGLGSGRRKLAPTTGELPPIGEDETQIGLFVDELAVQVAQDRVDPRVADTLKDLARTKLAAIRQRTEREKLDELQEILKRAEAVKADGMSYEEACRQHREEPEVARWTVQRVKGREIWTRDAGN